MKKRLFSIALFLLLAPAGMMTATATPNEPVSTKNFSQCYVFYGYKTATSTWYVDVTVYVAYNPSTDEILSVDAEDEYGNPLSVAFYDGTIYASGGVLYATGFRVDLTRGDYVVLNGAFTMI